MKKLTPECIETVISLESKQGKLEPDQIINEATKETSPLHYYFEWDDEVAGAAYRLDQARELIRRVKIVVTYEETEIKTVRYIRDVETPGDEQGYIAVKRIKAKNVNATLAEELERVSGYLMRALTFAMVREEALPEGTIRKIEGIRDEIDSLIESL
jgi:hypothetical protein